MAERMVGGRYELLERLEVGWRARDTDLGREVVVLVGDEADLDPAGVGRIFDRGEADGERFAVYEYLPADEPPTLIQAPPPSGRRLPRSRTVALAGIAMLLAAAGIAAALMATAGTSSTDEPRTASLSVPVPTATSAPPTEQTAPPPTTEQETTTQKQTATPEPRTAPPPTIAPPVTTAPPVATFEPPPTTTEELPPTTTAEPPPTTTG